IGKARIKPNYRRRVLRLPDLDHCKTAVLNSLGSQASRRVYEYAIGVIGLITTVTRNHRRRDARKSRPDSGRLACRESFSLSELGSQRLGPGLPREPGRSETITSRR